MLIAQFHKYLHLEAIQTKGLERRQRQTLLSVHLNCQFVDTSDNIFSSIMEVACCYLEGEVFYLAQSLGIFLGGPIRILIKSEPA